MIMIVPSLVGLLIGCIIVSIASMVYYRYMCKQQDKANTRVERDQYKEWVECSEELWERRERELLERGRLAPPIAYTPGHYAAMESAAMERLAPYNTFTLGEVASMCSPSRLPFTMRTPRQISPLLAARMMGFVNNAWPDASEILRRQHTIEFVTTILPISWLNDFNDRSTAQELVTFIGSYQASLFPNSIQVEEEKPNEESIELVGKGIEPVIRDGIECEDWPTRILKMAEEM